MKKLDLINCPLDGVNLIEASAGTGKTYSIANLYLRFILEKELTVQEILVVTFTEAATKELKERLRKNILEAQKHLEKGAGQSKDETVIAIVKKATKKKKQPQVEKLLRRALLNIDEMAVFTIHGFCKRMLNENAFESKLPFDLELKDNATELLQEIINDYWRQHNYGTVNSGINQSREQLLTLATMFTSSPNLKLSFPYHEDVDPESVDSLFDNLIKDANEFKDEIVAILTDKSNKLSRGKGGYCAENVEIWLNQLMSGDQNQVKLFSQSYLDRKITSTQKKRGVTAIPHAFFTACDEYCQYTQQIEQNRYHDFINWARDEFVKRKTEKKIQTFDDLILNLNAALKSDSGASYCQLIREKFKVAMIDEFQDTDPIQNEVFQRIFMDDSAKESMAIFMIGDPKQSIYGFRGADVLAYLSAKQLAGEDRSYSLDTNYRSETNMVDAVNQLFIQSESESSDLNPFLYDTLPNDQEGINYHRVNANGKKRKLKEGSPKASLQIDYIDALKALNKERSTASIIKFVTYEVSRLLCPEVAFEEDGKTEPVKPKDIAILTNSHSQAAMLQRALSRYEIPSVIQKSGHIFESEEADELELTLLALLRPGALQVNSFLTTPFVRASMNELHASVVGEGTLALDWTQRLIGLHQVWVKSGFMTMFQQLLQQSKLRSTLLALSDGERRLTNFQHLGELLHQASIKQQLSPDGLVEWFAEQRSGELEENDENLMRLESDADRVTIMTVHKSKGLEFNIVFCPFFGLRSFKEFRKNDFIYYGEDGQRYFEFGDKDVESESARLAWRKEQLAENIRLLYVGLTRAVNRCYLTVGNFTNMGGSAVAYIASASEGLELDDYIANPPSSDLSKLVQEGLVEVNDCDPDELVPIHYQPLQNDIELQEAELFNRKLTNGWGIGSFSGLTRFASHGHKAAEMVADHDDLSEFTDEITIDQKDHYAFFDFPRGATVGSAVHEIFEDIDFTADSDAFKSVIELKLKRFALIRGRSEEEFKSDLEDKTSVVLEMVENVLSAPIQALGDFQLSQLPWAERLVEMQFYYPVKKITPGELAFIFKTYGVNISSSFGDQLGQLKFSLTEGFMTGFIDLIFQEQDKFYILDWKTNHLGSAFVNYSPEILSEAMADSYYILQYHLYVVALHLYLKQRLGDEYEYERDMGGVVYTYVRGMHPEHPGAGLFFDKPKYELISALTKLFVEDK